ncbi:hypothetical protein BKA65DRAFT_495597 [Rhexocercosporidium sp. MPI-PUGE-AT-0058]|nr:hypothetical protein BKA65DRAFT_495597 [Rhexocercosporidium sp. MPI-PUGE-AT-0058]
MYSTKSHLPRNIPTLLDVLGQYGIFDTLCRRLDTATLLSLRLVAKRLADHFTAHAKERWNVNRRLKNFVRNPQGLRAVLARYNALISGSFVIQFFDDTFWKESDLDIYVERESAAAFGTYLCQNEGYRFDRHSTEVNEYDFLGFSQVDTYLRGDMLQGDETKIQVISTSTVPVRCILGCFSSTAVINFMSWNTAYSLFPAMTFLEPRTQCRVSWIPDNEDCIQSQIEKYSTRGWTDVTMLFEGSRRVGDRHSWKVALDVKGVEPSHIPDFVLENCYFRVENVAWLPREDAEHLRRTVAEEFTSEVLKYIYTAGGGTGEDFWRNLSMNARLHGLILDELWKLEPGMQPLCLTHPTQWPEFDQLVYLERHNFMVDFIKPDTWNYYDEQVSTWREEWEGEMGLRGLEDQMAAVTMT